MAFAFASEAVNINQLVVDKTSTIASSMSLGEFEALLSGGVLQELDAQISLHKSEIEAGNEKKSALRNDITEINKLLSKETAEAVTFKNANLNDKLKKEGKTAPLHNTTAIPISAEQKSALSAIAKRVGLTEEFALNQGSDGNGYSNTEGTPNQRYVTKEFLDTLKSEFENQLTDLNSTAETDTIKFQALMDARKQTLMMLSNMISSDNQTKMSIINNMKS